jgi:UDP-N-acetyl-D-galactosamine dehydrogenase
LTYKIGIIGLGYVGLPLSLAFAAKYKVIGYDINTARVAALVAGIDATHEVEPAQINAVADHIVFTDHIQLLKDCNIFIITVPTPVDAAYQPDLSFLVEASVQVAGILKKGDIVIYESTVYPGCTEEECMPVLAQHSGLVYNQEFFIGYSPERINPGDRSRPITSILKITSGSNEGVARIVNELYASVITAGTYLAPSIKVAEAAKAIENAQRDVNISFMNELALIFDRLGIDTMEVLKAAGTKWNFLPFKPGLVGGHCIGVDPHYLAYKAMQVGYDPQVILSGRKVNEQMGVFVGEKVVALLAKKYAGNIAGKTVLILGFAFKENCSDIRNTKVIDIYTTLTGAGLQVRIVDPMVNADLVKAAHGINLVEQIEDTYHAIILAVAHDCFNTINFKAFKQQGAIIYDTKSMIDVDLVDARL